MLLITVGILIILVILLGAYIIFFQLQLNNINKQLMERLNENTHQVLTVELLSKRINDLVVNINKTLKAEENLRLESIREEKHFKEMIANISHDLRTPLTAIKGYQQLMGKGELTTGQREKLQIAERHADELGKLIEHFFEYTYLLNAEASLQIEHINLTNVVTECLAEAIVVLEEKNIAVNFIEPPAIFVLADREMTVRILHNLIRNVLEHSKGDVEVQIRVETNAIIVFRNPVRNAIEIDVERIFDRFYTANKARSKSTGLGLSIVKLLAEQMGGSTSAALINGYLEISVELPIKDKVIER